MEDTMKTASLPKMVQRGGMKHQSPLTIQRTSRASGQARAAVSEGRKTTSTSAPRSVPRSFLNKLGEMHTAEKELVLALPLLVKAAESDDLKSLLRLHLKDTRGQARALEAVAVSLHEKLPMKVCPRVTKLIGQAVMVMAKGLLRPDQDAELIRIGREIEQFEIDSYTALCATAKERNFTHERALLESILGQEKMAQDLLGEVGRGEHPLREVIRKAVLRRAGAK